MNNISLKNFQNKLLFVVAFLIMTLTFAYNFLDTDNTMYEGFQQDSESLAEGALYAGKFGLEMQHFGLGSLEGLAFHPGYNMNELNDLFAVESNIPFVNNTYTRTYLVIGNLLKFSDGITLKISDVQVSDDKYIIKLDKPSSENDQLNTFIEHYEFLDSDGNTLPNKHINIYPSQYGLQGKVYYYLARLFPVTTEGIKLILSALLAVVLLIIVQGINKKYDSTMAVCWYIVFLLSPWIVSFSNNLYWVSFTWFLPMAVALYCPKDNKRFIFYALLFAAVFIKCLCGYEYISTIMLSMIVFPVVTWLKSPAGKERNISLQNIIFLGGFAVLAFVAAVGWHAYQVGVGNLQEGISTILGIADKRIQGHAYSAELDSLSATRIETVASYFNFPTQIITGLDGNLFVPIVLLSFSIVAFCIIKKDNRYKQASIMLLVGFLASISWFVLAKGHSYIHTHMNYVLWYFGFIQMCLYVIFCELKHQVVQLRSTPKA